MDIKGVWLPIITPFNNENVDFESYKKLIEHYVNTGIKGIMPLGTSGEIPTLDDDEYEELISKTVEYVHGRLPIFIGLGGNNTKKLLKQLKLVEKYKIDGILSVSPYYSRPEQRGIYDHFRALSESSSLNIVIYNIPYRTGRNIENETLMKLAELKNIIGVKDCCGDIKQTTELIFNKPEGFSVLTGDDGLFYTNLTLGGDGGILASSHIKTETFVKVYDLLQSNNFSEALKLWKSLYKFIPSLFEEPNPAPIKYYLNKIGIINSAEVRLPLTEISEGLKKKLDNLI
ncbi:4-hydroxy-tetrahydrodipicolinate synthase [Clostridium sp. 19966]|uniref:4-hydroxy-tetrahydrodipicolinate synthase n=1 Tax=Clostridium sp. 19966 TaxID=2768166 RepID=UPI0028E03E79|nr:4-hydroxy-tetrahydrodipicolinate synthase [Clostridium sp. 19966]MDT8718928.1 4-hydroxy-tetrahydrodipicolinate synthase [Clostridium sp. 19966]